MIQNAREIFGIELSPDNTALLDALGIMPPDQAERLLSTPDKEPPPPQWETELVKERLVAAAELIERLERRVGPSNRITFWIDYRLFRDMDAFDRNAQAEGYREKTRAPDRPSRGGASAREIAEAEAALEWPTRYLADEGERRVLALWLSCYLRNAPFGQLAHKVSGSKGTAYRRLERALARIVAGLQADGVPTT